jgi:hypothetical protein
MSVSVCQNKACHIPEGTQRRSDITRISACYVECTEVANVKAKVLVYVKCRVTLEGKMVCLVHLPLFDLIYQPQMMDYDECGEVGGMIGRAYRNTQKKTCRFVHHKSQMT